MTWRLETEIVEIDLPPGYILVDADLGNTSEVLALARNEVGDTYLGYCGQKLTLPESAATPSMVRLLPNRTALIVAPRQRKGQNVNAWIIDLDSGARLRQFSVGDAVEDVLVLKDYIAVSYFDEALGSHTPASSQGLSFFSHEGEYLFGYRERFHPPVFVCDCYGMAATGSNRLTFCAYTDFEMVDLDLNAQTQVIRPAPPAQIAGPRLMAIRGRTAFMIATYESASQTGHRVLYAFDLKTRDVDRVWETPLYLRAHGRGLMLATSDKSLHVFTPLHHS